MSPKSPKAFSRSWLLTSLVRLPTKRVRVAFELNSSTSSSITGLQKQYKLWITTRKAKLCQILAGIILPKEGLRKNSCFLASNTRFLSVRNLFWRHITSLWRALEEAFFLRIDKNICLPPLLVCYVRLLLFGSTLPSRLYHVCLYREKHGEGWETAHPNPEIGRWWRR